MLDALGRAHPRRDKGSGKVPRQRREGGIRHFIFQAADLPVHP